jgi:endonuclease IV
MKSEDLIGFHIGGSVAVSRIVEDLEKSGIHLYQVFLSSPRAGGPAQLTYPMFKFMKRNNVVVHSPYWVSFAQPKKAGYNLKWVMDLFTVMATNRLRLPYVTHLGYPEKREDGTFESYEHSIEATIRFLRKLLFHWPPSLNGRGRIYLETDSGCKGGNGFNSIQGLVEVVKELNDERVRICFDTEHHYASGSPDPDNSMWDYVGLCHLNAIPEKVRRGSHLDRHSITYIKDSKEGPKPIIDIAKKCIQRKIPMILERRDVYLMIEDRQFVLDRV